MYRFCVSAALSPSKRLSVQSITRCILKQNPDGYEVSNMNDRKGVQLWILLIRILYRLRFALGTINFMVPKDSMAEKGLNKIIKNVYVASKHRVQLTRKYDPIPDSLWFINLLDLT